VVPERRALPTPSYALPIVSRCLHTGKVLSSLLPPDSAPPCESTTAKATENLTAASLNDDDFHNLADAFLERVLAAVEDVQEKRDDIDVDYHDGVMNVTVREAETFVLNKQPPNKQIWLSSPVSGPKRYDWVVFGETMADKEDSGQGDWVYLRDGSLLRNLLHQEVGLHVEDKLPTVTVTPGWDGTDGTVQQV